MKKTLLFLCAFLATTVYANIDNAPDDILGFWLSENGQAQIQVYKEGDKYFGKIIWLKVPDDPKKGGPKKDYNNPKESLRDRPILGLVILRDFSFKEKEWSGGYVYDPQNGKEYKCYLKLKDPKTLSMRGYIGISLLGRTETWTRVR